MIAQGDEYTIHDAGIVRGFRGMRFAAIHKHAIHEQERIMHIRKLSVAVLLLALLGGRQVIAGTGEDAEGVITLKSHYDVKTTADRLVKVLRKKGMTVFARIDHAAGARRVGKRLLPTQLVIFGNPKVGTPLMHCARSVAIDLPQKALIWRDAGGRTWYSYNDPAYLAQRHHIRGCKPVLAKIGKALGAFAHAATGRR